MNRFCSSTLLLVALASTAGAQDAGRTLDTSGVRARATADSLEAQKGGRSWFVSLLRKIARRSDETAADSVAAVDSASGNDVVATEAATTARAFKSRKDSVAWEGARTVADKSEGYRVVVDLFAKTLRVIDREDTLRTAPVATAMNASLEYGGRVWRFETPRGVRRVQGKDKDPVWTPPDWHYAEVATENGLKMRHLSRGQVIRLRDGTRLTTKGDEVGVILPEESEFVPLVLDAHVVFDNTIFVPPMGTKHRTIQGELGHFRLKLGDGYQLHGTPYAQSIGAAVTHGCVRLRDEDIEWLFANVPVGTKVYLY